MTKRHLKLYQRSGSGTGTVYVLPKKNWHLESCDTPIILPREAPIYPSVTKEKK